MVFGLFKNKRAPNSSASSKTMTEQFAQIGDQRVAYWQSGPTDKTIVFIHGNSACKAAFAKQFPVVQDAGYGVLAVDLPGHGASDDAE